MGCSYRQALGFGGLVEGINSVQLSSIRDEGRPAPLLEGSLSLVTSQDQTTCVGTNFEEPCLCRHFMDLGSNWLVGKLLMRALHLLLHHQASVSFGDAVVKRAQHVCPDKPHKAAS